MNFGIVVAAGKSERMGPDVDKVFLSMGTRPILAYSLLAFEQCPLIDGVVLVVRKDRLESARGLVQVFGCSKVQKVVAGGPTRQASVMNGLAEIPDEAGIVAVHDGARPCVTPDLIAETVKTAKRTGAGVAAVKITDTVKEVERGFKVTRTIDRSKLWVVQTPQTFKRDILVAAYEFVAKKRLSVTDEASAVERTGHEVHLVPAPWSNVKITTPDDLALVATLLKV
jgi:2-C-methyl-D-erythritol 4-phosphate cytidylyltransferase